MPLSKNRPGYIRRILRFRTKSRTNKGSSRKPLIIAGVALLAAVAFSVSVESRSGGTRVGRSALLAGCWCCLLLA